MSDIVTLLYQFLKNKFGDLDWNNGSVLRELVAAPIVALAEEATKVVNAAYNALNISNLLANPEENAEAIDNLFNYLGLNAPTTTYSTGSVKLLLTSSDDFTIPAGASFEYNDSVLLVPKSYTASMTTPVSDTVLKIEPVRYNVYQVIVPVTSGSAGVSLSSGTALTWTVINPSIYSATVYEAISGSGIEYTATQKINQIRQQLFPPSLSCSEGFLKTINSYSENLAVDCTLSVRRPQLAVEVYVKSLQPPTVWTVAAVGTPTGNTNEYSATISSTGILAVREITGANVVLSGVYWGPQRTATVTWTDSSGGDVSAVSLEVFGLPDLQKAQQAIDKYTANTGINVIVKTPRLLELSMNLPVVDYVGTDTMSKLVSAVNNSLLNATGLGDHTVAPLIKNSGNSMIGAGTYTLKDLLSGKVQTSVASVNTTVFTDTTTPFAIYTSSDKISTSQNG